MSEHGREQVEKIFQETINRGSESMPLPPTEPATIHYTKLPEAQPGDVLFHEWNTYRREVGRLLSEGHEGRYILIKGKEIIGIWDTEAEAEQTALQKFLMQSCLIHQILTYEPVRRGPTIFWRCHS